jgi:glycosyltransferase involved in cell wall biosynthesis
VHRICFLLYNLDPGGLETYLLRFLKLKGNDIEATVITKSGRTGLLLNDYDLNNVKVIPIKSGYFNVEAWYRIFKIFKEGNWDSVCDLTSNFSGIYLFLAKQAKIKNRIAYYGQSSNHFKETPFTLIYNHLINVLVRQYSTKIISNSKSALDFFFKNYWLGDSRFKIIFNGVDASAFSNEKDQSLRIELGIPVEAKVIVHTGRLDEKKNHKAIIKLASFLKTTYPNIYFIICGKDTEKLSSMIESEGLLGHVFSLGYRKDVPLILRNADVFYFPSYSEGQPNSLIEAMLSGLPFVASDIESIRETLPYQYWSQLVMPDAIEAASRKIIEIIEGDNHLDFEDLRLWARDNFDADKRFDEFKSEIIGR